MKNFGKIKNAVHNILTDSVLKEDKGGNKNIKSYLNEMKKNDVLRREYLVYQNIEEANIADRTEAFDYIKENLSLLDGIDPKSILNENIKFTRKLNEDINKELKDHIEYKDGNNTKDLHENITELVHLKKTPANLNKRTELIGEIADHVQNNGKEDIKESIKFTENKDMSADVLIKFAVDKFNKKYKDLNESEKKIVRSIINNNDEEKKNVFEETKKDCLREVDDLLEENDDSLEAKHKLLKTKEKLIDMEYDPDKFSKDMNKMLTLKK